ncbi:unnamed protein product [Paramecium sonneborni]|uniref:Uncharacterized protein n=1 Tax=Paramecium sonneborni TaxID=65129 RepID=A0A8S1PFR2_9CILI|nr:unnamed protein product [Paramecium sonneborni]
MGSSFCKQDNSSQLITIVNKSKVQSTKEPEENDQLKIESDKSEIFKNQNQRNDQLRSEGISNNQTSDLSVKTEEIPLRKCLKCEKQISSIFVLTNCKKGCYYHQLCMEDHMKKLIEGEKPIIKCICGTKINSYFLRESSIPGKMTLLSRMFQRQLDFILQSTQKIRRDLEVQNFVKNNQLSTELHDYILIDQNLLIYEETPQ